MHFSAGEWLIVDSCINQADGQPAALSYLSEIGVEPEAVRLVVVTHWDDDHIHGIARVAEACERATIVCSAALQRKDIVQFVIAQDQVAGASGSGLDELRTLLRLARSRGGIVWAKANLPLYPRPPGDAPAVVALSPSEDAVERSIEALIVAAAQAESTIPRRFRAPEGPNGASVAAAVRAADSSVLLGADLEHSSNPEAGWEAVLTYSKPTRAASLVKVPHHASNGAHHDRMWQEMLTEDPVAIVTPWAKGAAFLPTEADLARLKAVSARLFVTAAPALKRVRLDPAVDKLVRKLHGDRLTELSGWGHVRARRRANEEAWRVDVRGDATEV